MKRVRRLTKTFGILLAAATISGCGLFGIFTPDEIVKHPDAPMLVLETSGEYARVAIYEAAGNRMVEYGWVHLEEVKAWTLHKFDWEAFIKKVGGQR